MSGIAEVLLNLGYTVSGSDLKRSSVTDRLAAQGATFAEGHAAAHVAGAHVVVTSTAVRPDNPEVVEARRAGIPVIPRAEMLAELMRLKYGVAVAGSHGKTTTTSMVALVLDKGGLDPTVVVGGRLGVLGSGARLGKGDFMVAEADESDRSFLKLTPTMAVVTNIDREHLDTYHDLDDIKGAFLGFVNKVPFYGAVVLCLDDAPVQDILPRVERRTVTYGLSPQAQVSARDLEVGPLGSAYTATLGGEPLGNVALAVPGVHNVVNSLAAVAVGTDLGLPFDAVKAGLESFTGVDRRFQVRGEESGRPRGRRLRAPPGGDPGHPRGLAPPGRRAPDGRPLPAASLHSHRGPVGRLLPGLPPGRRAARDRRLRGGGGAVARGERRGPGQGHRRTGPSPRRLRRPPRGRGREARGRGEGGRRRPHPGRGQRLDRGRRPPEGSHS